MFTKATSGVIHFQPRERGGHSEPVQALSTSVTLSKFRKCDVCVLLDTGLYKKLL